MLFDEEGAVVLTTFTQTSIFTSPDDEQFWYLNLKCHTGVDNPNVNLLFNPIMVLGLLKGISDMLNTMMGIEAMPEPTNQMALQFDLPIDWERETEAPTDITDTDGQKPPDRREDV
jgi:hypothetical protein